MKRELEQRQNAAANAHTYEPASAARGKNTEAFEQMKTELEQRQNAAANAQTYETASAHRQKHK